MTDENQTRIERDSMGEMEVPADVLYGASTQRAVENFPVSGRAMPDQLIRAYAMLKASCAVVNEKLGKLDAKRSAAIVEACNEIIDGLPAFGGLERHFPVDVFQTGSGTSTNMNANEVVANLVCVRHHQPIGSSKDSAWIEKGGVHPNDHVNMGQSSNDTFPTAMNVAAAIEIQDELLPSVSALAAALDEKATKWDRVVKIGRTHLQDATPIRLGQEFSGYAAQMRHAEERLHRSLHVLSELAIGGTAVGTGINTHKDFGPGVAAELGRRTGVHFREAMNHFEAQHTRDAAVGASANLRTIAVSLSKIAHDIRLLGSGPRCGVGELRLPAVQPGSSIMPGKVNPVICESVVQVCCQAVGNDTAITIGGFGGVGSLLDLNVAMPMIATNLLDTIKILTHACQILRTKVIEPLEADEARCNELIEGSLAMVTSLVPVIGYDKSAEIAKRAFAEGKTVRQLLLEDKVLSEAEINEHLDPFSMTEREG